MPVVHVNGARTKERSGESASLSPETRVRARTLPERHDPGHVEGRLTVSRLGKAEGGSTGPIRHTTLFVPDGSYEGMSDNDIRGFLDGTFVYGWNQEGQQHVRVGREAWHRPAPRFGEPELFRCLQRWSDLTLPPGADVVSAELTLTIEWPAPEPVTVLLYPVHKDWGPGRGGALGDNTSPPREGEVWWRAAAAGQRRWALPGASFSAAESEEADIARMPLARAVCSPGDESLTFASLRLAGYVHQRVREGRPCLFMLKLDDRAEDVLNSVVHLFSAEHGDSENPVRRPSLLLEWTCQASGTTVHEVHLERGRTIALEELDCRPGEWIAATFRPESGASSPLLEVREEVPGEPTRWRPVRRPFQVSGRRVQIRVRALRNPVEFGGEFTATVRDTWITTGPEESRRVVWRFRAPSGADHVLDSSFIGDYTWKVQFAPDEVGRWSYTWEHEFSPDRYEPAVGHFDVVASDGAAVLDALQRLCDELGAPADELAPAERKRLCRKFMNLERAAMVSMSPADWRGARGNELREVTRRIRSRLWGREVPASPPMEAHRRPWRHDTPSESEGEEGGDPGFTGFFARTVRRLRRALRRRLGS